MSLFNGLFDTTSTTVITPGSFLLCVGSALVIGLLLAACYLFRSRASKSFVATIALLPAAVCVVIMLVNGNIGTGVAVAGAFGLVRFRSAPGTAKEITAIFIAMTTGLAAGMGYIAYAFLIALLLGGASVLYTLLDFGARKNAAVQRTLTIAIPEELNYTDALTPILNEYASEYELVQVRTTDMGRLYRLTYNLTLCAPGKEKEMIDKLRCRNGNLEIMLSRQQTAIAEL
ncbi:MAG: DUF4956 domain-containing protein [Firmicutes bacterium]|nr:DUF4956 domain-containing protein [Bacillota bacterium]